MSVRVDRLRRTAILPDGTELPYVDAVRSIPVQPIEEDWVYADESNDNCVFARCLKRMFATDFVEIGLKFVYVKERDKRGSWQLVRYAMGKAAQLTVRKNAKREFDQLVLAGIEFCPPSPSQKLKAKAADSRWRRWGKKRPKIIKGKIEGSAAKKGLVSLREKLTGLRQFQLAKK